MVAAPDSSLDALRDRGASGSGGPRVGPPGVDRTASSLRRRSLFVITPKRKCWNWREDRVPDPGVHRERGRGLAVSGRNMEEPGNPLPNPSRGSENATFSKTKTNQRLWQKFPIPTTPRPRRAARLPVKPLPVSGETFKVSRQYF